LHGGTRSAAPARRCRSISSLAFQTAFDDAVLWYRKATSDRAYVVLVAVSLDPHHAREASVEPPL
jgi:starch synthase (maltosyl-transferring)